MAPTLFTLLFLLLAIVSVSAEPPKKVKQAPPDKVLVAILSKPEKCGKRVAKGHTITVNYIGKLFDDESVVFDDTLTSGPRDLKLGDQTIVGWEYGLRDMCVGEKRRLIIPSELAYGPMGSGDLIPPNSAVIFEIELLGISSIWTNPWMWLNLGALIAAFLYYIRMAQREELEKLKRAEERKALETQPAKSTAGRQGTTTHKPNEAKKDD